MRRVMVDPWITRIGGWSPERTYHTEGWNFGQAPWWVGGDPGDWPDLVVMPHVVISHAQIMKPQLKTRDTEAQWSFLRSSVNTLMCCNGNVSWFHKKRVQKLCVSSQTVPHLPCVFISLILIWILYNKTNYKGFPGGSDGKSVYLQCGRPGFNPRVGKIPWRRKWHPTPVLLPGKSHGRRSLVGYSPWGRKESDTTKRLHLHLCIWSWW